MSGRAEQGLMRTKRMDQYLNSRPLTLQMPCGWCRSQSTRGCRALPELPSLIKNHELCPSCQPGLSSGPSGLVLPNAHNCNRVGIEGVLEKVAREHHAFPSMRMVFSVKILRVSECPCKSSQNLLLSYAQSSILPQLPCSNPSALGQILFWILHLQST